ncbi:YetF domain-containing protein [Pseudomonas fluorescens]|uniref:YetF domain-containing protein n=1 Tax=Pseudomonas fluorescens TaxID=294 RepID=UPI002F926CEE
MVEATSEPQHQASGTNLARRFEKLIDGGPTIVVENGLYLRTGMHEARIEEDDIMQAARLSQCIETVDQIKFAIIERNGQISIITK